MNRNGFMVDPEDKTVPNESYKYESVTAPLLLVNAIVEPDALNEYVDVTDDRNCDIRFP